MKVTSGSVAYITTGAKLPPGADAIISFSYLPTYPPTHPPTCTGLKLTKGTVAYITTGAKLPPGADAVVKVEDTAATSLQEGEEGEKTVKILVSSTPGQWVRATGSDMAVGETILRRLTHLGPAEIGLLASVGRGVVEVYRKPIVGVMSTGDELVDAGEEEGEEGRWVVCLPLGKWERKANLTHPPTHPPTSQQEEE